LQVLHTSSDQLIRSTVVFYLTRLGFIPCLLFRPQQKGYTVETKRTLAGFVIAWSVAGLIGEDRLCLLFCDRNGLQS
jgi:hypothetical protein